ncbi:MAG: excinuclease ABC subunit UvrB [bacterium]
MPEFKVVSEFKPCGDQEKAINYLSKYVHQGAPHSVLLGVTGSGKTFTIANIIQEVRKPALVISHNKTLAAQLFSEFRTLFPENAVEYFVSYYDYYQPEAYIPQTNTYIEKDASINDEIERMRHSATRSLLDRRDVIVVASVSCIYGLGSPKEYRHMSFSVETGAVLDRDELLRALVEIQYSRNDFEFERGRFRVRGDIVEIFPTYEREAVRLQIFGDLIESIELLDPLTGTTLQSLEKVTIYPNSHYVLPQEKMKIALDSIRDELRERLSELRSQDNLVAAQTLEQRTNFDLEMMESVGFCHGIENYSRHLDGRAPGEPPATLIDYFPKDFLIIIDESHVTIPQIRAMWAGDRSRKRNLVDFGFRLPSAYDNRPLTFDEFVVRTPQVLYSSATPGNYESEVAQGRVVEQIIRPTGLIDPEVIVRPATSQVDDLLGELKKNIDLQDRSLVTTLTKKMAEDLTDYYQSLDMPVRYLHSEINTIERVKIIYDFRVGKFDVLIGINLLREGLDLPEVSLVAILDADKEGFLRSEVSLIQTIGRAARNARGRVILYADTITQSMKRAIDETNRRRRIQKEYNRVHGITPKSITKSIDNLLHKYSEDEKVFEPINSIVKDVRAAYKNSYKKGKGKKEKDIREIDFLRAQMKRLADELEFEKAAQIRDLITELTNNETAV